MLPASFTGARLRGRLTAHPKPAFRRPRMEHLRELDSGANHVTWEDVEDAADDVFNIWVDHPEIAWARSAWNVLAEAGLTHYATELERTRVLARLLALGEIYRDFCACAWEECTDAWLSELAAKLDVGPFRVGQLMDRDFLEDDALDDEELFSYGVEELVGSERQAVADNLAKAFGSTSALFVSMWLSRAPDFSGAPWEALDREILDEILNEPTDEKLAAFSWIESGMPPYRG